jgi:hypothetical protein
LTLSVIGGAWAMAHFRQVSITETVVRLQIDPPEGGRFTSGFAGGTALSPDGTAVAYVASANGKSGLWIRPIDNTTARLIPGTEAASLPFWSPDNKSIAFFMGDKLQRVDPAGGALVTICYVGQYGVGVGGAWSSDGYIIFGAGTSGLFQVSATGGVASMLTTLGPSEIMHRWPQILPGGRFLYFAASYKREDSGVYIASRTKPGERVRLLTSDTSAVYAGTGGKDYLIWLRSGALVAQGFDTNTLKLSGEPHQVAGPIVTGGSGITNVSVSRTGLLLYGSSNALLTQLTWFDRTGRVLSVVDEPGEFIMFRLSPDGRRVITERVRAGVPDLWLLETAVGRSCFRPASPQTCFARKSTVPLTNSALCKRHTPKGHSIGHATADGFFTQKGQLERGETFGYCR